MAHTSGVRTMTLHWTISPIKNREWAIKERSKPKYIDESIWYQEQDCSFEKSTTARVFKGFKSAKREEFEWCHLQRGLDFEYDERYPVVLGIDFGATEQNPAFLAFAQEKESDPIYSNYGKTNLIFFDELQTADFDVDGLGTYLNGLPYRFEQIVGDFRTGNQAGPKGKSWCDYLWEAYGLYIDGKYNDEITPITKVQKRLRTPGALSVNYLNCPLLVKAFQNWSYPVNKETGLVEPKAKPKRDMFSHPMNAVMYLIDFRYLDTYDHSNRPTYWETRVLSQRAMI